MTRSGISPEAIIKLNFSSVPVVGELTKSKLVFVFSLRTLMTEVSFVMGMVEVLGQNTVTVV